MSGLIQFFKTTILGGLFVLLPIMLLYFLIRQLMGIAVALASPIADLFPFGTFDDVKATWLTAVLLILALSFLLGLLVKLTLGRQLGGFLEERLLIPIPGYRAIKDLTRSLAEAPEAQGFRPALLVWQGGMREMVYLIEDLGNGYATVLLPWAPTPLAGSVKIVPVAQLEMLEASLGEVAQVLSYWGFGARKFLGSRLPSPETESS